MKEYTKSQLIKSEKYGRWADLLSSALKDGELYNTETIEKIISDFKEKVIK